MATPNGLSVSNCYGGSGLITALAGSNVVGLSGAALDPNSVCGFSVNVLATSTGSFLNTTTVTGFNGPGNTASDTLVVGPARTPLPPSISDLFAQSNIPAGQATRLNFVLTNPNSALALSGVGFSDTLPAGQLVSSPSGFSGTCGGMSSAVAGSNLVSLSGASLGPNASCILSANVVPATSGSFLNTTTPVTSTEAGAGNAAKDLLVVTAVPPRPVLSKLFGQSPILVGQTTPLTFTIKTGGASDDPISFTDTLPAGLVVATPNGLSVSNCYGGTGTISAVAGSNVVGLSDAALDPNSVCGFSVNVLATSTGSFLNTTSVLLGFNEAAGNTASDTLVVGPARTPLPPSISKFFAQSNIPAGQTTRLNFVLTNPNSALALSGVGFSDTLPAGLLVSDPSGFSGTCGGTSSAVAGSNLVSLSGASLDPNASCILSAFVVPATSGSFLNTTTPVTSSEAGAGNAARDLLVVTAVPPRPVLSKLFGQSPIPVGQTTPLTFTIKTGGASDDPISFTDTLPAGLVVATPNGLSVNPCYGGSGTISAVAGSNVLGLSGAALDPNSVCGFTVNVLATSTGSFLNTTSVLLGFNEAAGNTASDELLVTSATQTITFGALSNQAFGTPPLTVSASASSGLPVRFTALTTSVCSVSGNIVTLLMQGTCTIQASQAGNTNFSAATPVTQSFSVVGADMVISKSHVPNFSQGQMSAAYTITVGNSGSGPTVGTVQVVDVLPGGLTATGIGGTAWSCTLGTLTCTRSDALGGGSTYPAITVTVNISSTAPASVTNQATVSGGGRS